MTEREKVLTYSAPPILEAVIQFTFADALSKAAMRKLTKRLKRDYHLEAASENIEVNVDFAKRGATFNSQPQVRISSEDETDAVVVQPSGLTWSRVARVRRDQEIATGVTGYRKLVRVGVRYVNRLDTPTTDDVIYYEDYLAINIDIPNDFIVENYGWRFEHFYVQEELLAIVQPDCISICNVESSDPAL